MKAEPAAASDLKDIGLWTARGRWVLPVLSNARLSRSAAMSPVGTRLRNCAAFSKRTPPFRRTKYRFNDFLRAELQQNEIVGRASHDQVLSLFMEFCWNWSPRCDGRKMRCLVAMRASKAARAAKQDAWHRLESGC